MVLVAVHIQVSCIPCSNCYTLDPFPTLWFQNATEHYSLCNLGNLLRQVLWVLLLSALREILELRTLRLSIYNRRCLTLASLFFTVVPVRVRGSHTYSADTTVE